MHSSGVIKSHACLVSCMVSVTHVLYFQGSAFWGYINQNQGIDGYYVDGVSLTHGGAGSRQHIWTFAAGISEHLMNALFVSNPCPCDVHDDDLVPAFIQDNFFCESGLHSPWRYQYILYPDDVLWDGQNYMSNSTCCTLQPASN